MRFRFSTDGENIIDAPNIGNYFWHTIKIFIFIPNFGRVITIMRILRAITLQGSNKEKSNIAIVVL